jgi:hypothetical protein
VNGDDKTESSNAGNVALANIQGLRVRCRQVGRAQAFGRPASACCAENDVRRRDTRSCIARRIALHSTTNKSHRMGHRSRRALQRAGNRTNSSSYAPRVSRSTSWRANETRNRVPQGPQAPSARLPELAAQPLRARIKRCLRDSSQGLISRGPSRSLQNAAGLLPTPLSFPVRRRPRDLLGLMPPPRRPQLRPRKAPDHERTQS